jgi:hypothetical protein
VKGTTTDLEYNKFKKKNVAVAVALIVLRTYNFLEVKVHDFSADNHTTSTLCNV